MCDPIEGSPPGSPVPGILQPRTLEWVAISFSNAWKWKVKVKSISRVRLLATPWTAAHQASLFMGFSRQEYWSGVPSPSPCEVGVLNINWIVVYRLDLTHGLQLWPFSPPGRIWRCLDMFLVITTKDKVGRCYWHLMVDTGISRGWF